MFQHINDLSQRIDLNLMLSKAEGIYEQIISASHLTNSVRYILGLEIIPDEFTVAENINSEEEDVDNIVNNISPTSESIHFHPDAEVAFTRSIDLSYY